MFLFALMLIRSLIQTGFGRKNTIPDKSSLDMGGRG
jgi:hypothetical protein